MSVIKSLIIAFSTYSKIPMPQFAWKKEDMKYMMCFFPWVGAVIGCVLVGWSIFYNQYQMGELCYALVGVAIPLVITGGFHVDGYMDTMDAFHSYQPKEKKLEILKDAHIGAFSVIMLAVCGLIYTGAFSEIKEMRAVTTIGAGFVLSRVLSGIGVVTFPKAKKDGMLYTVAESAQQRLVLGVLIVEGILCIVFMLWNSIYYGSGAVIAAIVCFVYYYYHTKKELGGVTGDNAGYFVVMCETSMVVVTAICNIIRGSL